MTANGDLYELADTALETSLDINDSDNFLAYAGQLGPVVGEARLRVGRGVRARTDSRSTSTARSSGARSATPNCSSVGTPTPPQPSRRCSTCPRTRRRSLGPRTSASCAATSTRPTRLMQRALDDAPTPADRSFALLHLGDLAFNVGDATSALDYYRAALDALPDSAAAFAGQARAEAALGTDRAPRSRTTKSSSNADSSRSTSSSTPSCSSRSDVPTTPPRNTGSTNGKRVSSPPRSSCPTPRTRCSSPTTARPSSPSTNAQRAVDTHRSSTPKTPTRGHSTATAGTTRRGKRWRRRSQLDTPSALYHYHAGMIRLALGDAVERS